MSSFITNNKTSDLKKRLIELTKKSEELKFLVGFFYFSGIKELYEGLKSNPETTIKVLVGLNIDRLNFELVESSVDKDTTDEEKIYKFFESVKRSLNTEDFDTKEFYEQVRFFLELIAKDKLLIRKTFKPNHSKLYIFKLEKEQAVKELFITGSSNLTKSGLSTQNEFNVEISNYGFDEAEDYFDRYWEDAVKITEFEEMKKNLIKLVEKETLVKDVTPFEAFCLVLKTYLDSFQEKKIGDSLLKTLQDNGYIPYRYQLDAVKQALSIIEKNNGIIIADVVGLGKSIIASCIAKQLKKRGIVICPPGLVGDKSRSSGWRKYLGEFGLYDWEPYSRGNLREALNFLTKNKDIEVVIIDEVHWFRNQDTENYELLKNICREKQVILLTATPFNNRPGDILSLLKLFITPKQSSITLESNLVDQFKVFKGMFDKLGFINKHWNSLNKAKRFKAQNYYKSMFGDEKVNLTKVSQRAQYLAKQIRNVIEPVTIRRNRLDLQNHPNYKQEVRNLSKVSDPQEWYFELSKEQSDFYTEVIENYFGDPNEGGKFKGAIYRPFEYEKGLKKTAFAEVEEKLSLDDNRTFQQQRNLFDFMRRLLVKRFESSFGSFEQSIKNFKKITERCQLFINKTGEYILDRSLLEKIYELDLDDIEKYLIEYEKKISKGEYPKTHKRYVVSKFKDKEEFLENIQNDIDLFNEVLTKLNNLDLVKNDPKTACLLKKLKKQLEKTPKTNEPKRKIIIFSEYLDTVKYLEQALNEQYGDKLLVVSDDLNASTINKLNSNFDASHKEPKNEYKLLLATDKISEGFNLNRAGMVINYDIPWNPVRVIQRLGRINRISKKVFEKLYIVNFFPTEKGAELVKSREIAANKMFLIHTALGEDSKIFDVDEKPSVAGLFNRIQQNPDSLEEESFYTKALRTFSEIETKHPDIVTNIKDFPSRIKVAKKGDENELMVFFTKGRLFVTCAKTDEDEVNPYHSVFEDVYEKISCGHDEKSFDWNTDQFWNTYQAIRDYKDFRSGSVNEQSLEQKALNKLDDLIKNKNVSLIPYKDFLRTLKKDILEYATLPEYTLRRIMNFEPAQISAIHVLLDELGEDYLLKEKNRIKEQKKEIIIAIENKK